MNEKTSAQQQSKIETIFLHMKLIVGNSELPLVLYIPEINRFKVIKTILLSEALSGLIKLWLGACVAALKLGAKFKIVGTTSFNPDYVIGFLRPDNVRGEACSVFTGSVAIARKSDCLEILA